MTQAPALRLKLDTPEALEEYRKSLEELVLTVLDPLCEEIEKRNLIPVPDPVREKFLERDYYKLGIPKEWGGYGLSVSQLLPILETGAKGHAWNRGGLHGSHSGMGQLWRVFYQYGTEEQKREWMPRACEGIFPGMAITELNSGSGVDVDTTAAREGDHYKLNGTKKLISYAELDKTMARGYPGLFTVVRTADRSLGEKAISFMLVDVDAPGYKYEAMPDMFSFHKLYYVTFEDCKVPVKNLVGEEGQGWEVCTKGFLDISRVSIGTACVGLCQRMMELSIEFAKQRVTFGKPIAKRQMIQQMLAEMAVNIHAARLICTDAARRYDEGILTPMYAAMAKVFAIEMSAKVSDNGLLVHGGMGLTKLFPVERIYRDIRSLWCEEGTPTVQKATIAKELLNL